MAQYLMLDTFWTDKLRFDDAEIIYQEKMAGACQSTLVSEIAKARQQIQQTLCEENTPSAVSNDALVQKISSLEAENRELRKVTDNLSTVVKQLEQRISALEVGSGKPQPANAPQAAKKLDDDDDDDFDLFGDDDDEDEVDEEAERIKAERLAAYQAKKAKKPEIIAKSSVLLDIKPWDDETDMKEAEIEVRKITMDGLVWGASKLVPLAYGIKKLQIISVVEDEKVSIDELSDKICELEDYVQSVDIAAFNKI